MRAYRYNLIRYVPYPARMEPINVGVILQGDGKLDVRFNVNASRLAAINAEEFRKWRQFLVAEIQTQQPKLFQPDRTTERFLRYLEGLCDGPIYLSRPLVLINESDSFEQILNSLDAALVAPPEASAQAEEKRPTGLFRRLAEEMRFVERGMRKYSHIVVGNHRLWAAYRQVDNGDLTALDKVSVGKEIGETSNEIERLPKIAGAMKEYLSNKIRGKETRHYLLVDELSAPFTGQSQDDFDMMRRDLDEQVKSIQDNGGKILRSPNEVEELVVDLDRRLPPPPANQPAIPSKPSVPSP